MRSHDELVKLCEAHGVALFGSESSREMMDLLREAIGTFDPDLQIDPMKAVDLKNRIDWSADGALRFKPLERDYLNSKHICDLKLDGARMRLFLGASSNTMNTGRRSVKTFAYIERADNFPQIQKLIVPELAGTVLDGEMMPPANSIILADGSKTQGPLNSIMAMVNSSPPKARGLQLKNGDAFFVAFDVLQYCGEDVMGWTYEKRRELLELIVQTLEEAWEGDGDSPIKAVPQMEASAESIQRALDAGFEGVIIKRKDSRYEPGKRPKSWAKIKHMSTGDFFIVGSVPGNGRNEGKVGSMKVAYFDPSIAGPDDERSVVYVADVGGITDAFRDELTDPTTGAVKNKYLGTVIEVQAQGRTRHNRLRHPMFKRVRPDKTFEECTPDCSIDLFEEV